MIISKSLQAQCDADPNKKAFVEHYPYAFFGATLHYPRQAEVIRQWVIHQPKITVLTGWKRTGKTMCAVYLMACWFLRELNATWPGAKAMKIGKELKWSKATGRDRQAWIGGKSLDHVQNVLVPLYSSLIPRSAIHHMMTTNDKRIIGKDESKFLIRTYDQDLETWKSGSAEMVHLDEEPKISILNECLDRTRTTEGKILITVAIDDADVSWLPDACANPIKYFGTDSFLHLKMGIEDVPDEIYPPSEKENTYRKYDDTPFRNAVRKGDWAYISGKWWKEFGDHNIIDPFPIPDHWLKWRFMDAGMAAPAGCVWVAMHPRGDIFVYREYYKSGTTIEERCKDIIELSGNRRQKESDYFVEAQNRERYVGTYLDYHEFRADPVRGDSMDYYYIKEGLLVQESTTMQQEARREVINRWLSKDPNKSHFISNEKGAPRIYVFKTCTNLIWEAQKKAVKREKTDRQSISERKVDNRDDHLLDCVEYAVCELENWAGVSEKDFE